MKKLLLAGLASLGVVGVGVDARANSIHLTVNSVTPGTGVVTYSYNVFLTPINELQALGTPLPPGDGFIIDSAQLSPFHFGDSPVNGVPGLVSGSETFLGHPFINSDFTGGITDFSFTEQTLDMFGSIGITAAYSGTGAPFENTATDGSELLVGVFSFESTLLPGSNIMYTGYDTNSAGTSGTINTDNVRGPGPSGGTQPAPLPASVWGIGSVGLLGLAGFAGRRRVAV